MPLPPPNTAADTAHSAHNTQPAQRPHRATPRVEDNPPQMRRPHSIGLYSPLSEGPDPGSAQRHVNEIFFSPLVCGSVSLHVEYAERGYEYGNPFIFCLFYECIPLEYVRVPVIYRVHQAEYGIHILVAVSQEYVNTYSTPRSVSV